MSRPRRRSALLRVCHFLFVQTRDCARTATEFLRAPPAESKPQDA